MSDDAEISIVIATLNAAADLDRTLSSIESQRLSDRSRVQVLVIDGGSTDGTLRVAHESSVPDVLVSEPDSGIYDAMNKGARLASGRWLHFLNAGDGFHDAGSLAGVLDELEQARLAGETWMVGGAVYEGDGPDGGADGPIIRSIPHVWWRHAMALQPHCHQATWFRSDVFAAMGAHSTRHGLVGDFDLILRWGLVHRPRTDPKIRIVYARGGLSDRAEARIADAVTAVRRERLQLQGSALLADRGFVQMRRASIELRGLAGRARRRLLSSVVGSGFAGRAR